MTDKEAMKLVKILENIEDYRVTMTAAHELRRLHFENKALKEALAQPEQEQEPVALHIGWLVRNSQGKLDLLTELQIDSSLEKYERMHKLYTHPPQRKPLTLHQIHKALVSICYDGSEPTSTDDPEFVELIVPLARAIEAAHGIKENT